MVIAIKNMLEVRNENSANGTRMVFLCSLSRVESIFFCLCFLILLLSRNCQLPAVLTMSTHRERERQRAVSSWLFSYWGLSVSFDTIFPLVMMEIETWYIEQKHNTINGGWQKAKKIGTQNKQKINKNKHSTRVEGASDREKNIYKHTQLNWTKSISCKYFSIAVITSSLILIDCRPNVWQHRNALSFFLSLFLSMK